MATSNNNADSIRSNAISSANQAVILAIKSSKDHLKVLRTAVSKCVLVLIEYGTAEPLNKLFKDVSNHDMEGIRIFIKNLHKVYGWKSDKGLEAGPIKFKVGEGFSVRNNDPNNVHIAESKARIVKAGESELMKLDTGDKAKTGRDAEREFVPEVALANFIKKSAKEGASLSWLKKLNALNDDEHRLLPADIESAAMATSKALAKAKASAAKYEKILAHRAEKDKEIAVPEKQAANA